MIPLRFYLCALTFLGILLTFHPTLSAQSSAEDGYAFSSHCFGPPSIQSNGTVVVVPKTHMPPDCVGPNGDYTPAAIVAVYSKQATDELATTLRGEINDLTKKATDAIAASVNNNSVKSGEIDALVKSIQDRLYQDTLRRVKADLAKTQTPTATKPPKATP